MIEEEVEHLPASLMALTLYGPYHHQKKKKKKKKRNFLQHIFLNFYLFECRAMCEYLMTSCENGIE